MIGLLCPVRSALEVGAEPLGRVLDAEASAVLVNDVHEQWRRGIRVAAEREPGAQRSSDAGRERPRAGVVRLVLLVLLEAQRAAIQVDVLHLQARRLSDAGALAVQEAPQDAPAQRDRGAGQQARVLVAAEPHDGPADEYGACRVRVEPER
ncbi:hypothetical protein BE21_08710 [Sorangium cellulosum]|uniref:Uncharacterized protein n=1 Tax=Sorangium cellulosum TaxID=56 RepID=A0A150U2A6_SORCE|nr:hypothetical protein BE21_08710 [Sorangium cellulosum]